MVIFEQVSGSKNSSSNLLKICPREIWSLDSISSYTIINFTLGNHKMVLFIRAIYYFYSSLISNVDCAVVNIVVLIFDILPNFSFLRNKKRKIIHFTRTLYRYISQKEIYNALSFNIVYEF